MEYGAIPLTYMLLLLLQKECMFINHLAPLKQCLKLGYPLDFITYINALRVHCSITLELHSLWPLSFWNVLDLFCVRSCIANWPRLIRTDQSLFRVSFPSEGCLASPEANGGHDRTMMLTYSFAYIEHVRVHTFSPAMDGIM